MKFDELKELAKIMNENCINEVNINNIFVKIDYAEKERRDNLELKKKQLEEEKLKNSTVESIFGHQNDESKKDLIEFEWGYNNEQYE